MMLWTAKPALTRLPCPAVPGSHRAALALVAICMAAGCLGGAGGPGAAEPGATPAPGPSGDTLLLVPAGLGTLRQEEISLRLQSTGIQLRALPMNEEIIRLLAPDSYRALRELVAGNQERLKRMQQLHGTERFSIWYVSFYGLEPDARFNPSELVFRATGRDFRPLEIIALSAGFGQQRLGQRETQSALYLFDRELDPFQPLELTLENASTSQWQEVIRVLERERARVQARAGAGNRVDTLR